eukprot:gene9391-biopygen4702
MAVLLLHRSSTAPHPRQDARDKHLRARVMWHMVSFEKRACPAKWRLSLTRRALVCFAQSIRRNMAWLLGKGYKGSRPEATLPYFGLGSGTGAAPQAPPWENGKEGKVGPPPPGMMNYNAPLRPEHQPASASEAAGPWRSGGAAQAPKAQEEP